MSQFRVSNDYLPLFWVGRLPVYVTTLLVGVHVLAMILLSVASGLGGVSAGTFVFSSRAILEDFAVWQLGTYAFVHGPTLWFAVEMLFFFWFGCEVERFLGRNAFGAMYLLLLFAAPLALVALGPARASELAGSGLLHLAVFTAFAFVYPAAELLFRIRAKWFAVILVGLFAMQAVAGGDWPALLALAATLGALMFYLARSGVGSVLSLADQFLGRPAGGRSRETPRRAVGKKRPRPRKRPDPREEIDIILDKISKTGLASLTEVERKRLYEAREALLAQQRDGD